jgi:hypothetical protein
VYDRNTSSGSDLEMSCLLLWSRGGVVGVPAGWNMVRPKVHTRHGVDGLEALWLGVFLAKETMATELVRVGELRSAVGHRERVIEVRLRIVTRLGEEWSRRGSQFASSPA